MYDLIVVDPPWKVNKIIRKSRPNQTQSLDYSTMTLDEIKEFPIPLLADDVSKCFLWTTHAYLKDAFDVLDGWGFRYQRTLTWDKKKWNVPIWISSSH